MKVKPDTLLVPVVVGIGGSAGGLEALIEIFRYLPTNTGMAFALIQHLDATHKSLLADIISKNTKMDVIQPKNDTRIEPNHVYIIPPNKNMAISNGILTLERLRKVKGQHMSIDHFFCSLAEDRKHRAVGVILSGNAADGSLGLKAIKAGGGITIVQDVKSAKYDGMPNNAIATGCADFVLSPKGIAKKLADIGAHPRATNFQGVNVDKMPESGLKRVMEIVRRATGVDFKRYKQTTLKRRLSRRLMLHRLKSVKSYVRYLEETPSEVDALYNDLLIGVTSFFRDPEMFRILKQKVFPALLRNRSPEAAIRIWIVGCSTGEEVYSVAIALSEFLAGPGSKRRTPEIRIFGTDISEASITKARAGIYTKDIESRLSPERLRRFFTKSDRGYQVTKPVRDMCVFAKHDVTENPPFSNLDAISCRNVLIYFDRELQKRVMPIFHYALKPNGFLMLGAGESVGGFSSLFAAAYKKGKVFTKRPAPALLKTPFSLASDSKRDEQMAAPFIGAKMMARDITNGLQTESDRLVLARHAPAGVVVNADMEIIQFRGQVGRYLEPAPGAASLNLLRVVRQDLSLELRKGIHHVRKMGTAFRKEGVTVQFHGGHLRKVTIEVLPLKIPLVKERYFVVLFENESSHRSAEAVEAHKSGTKNTTQGAKAQKAEIHRLKEDLASTKEYLQSVVEEKEAANEELRSANEELLTSNEEFQSTNEELESAKEELNSTNEEIVTLNEELVNRNAELKRGLGEAEAARDYAEAVIETVREPLIVLDSDLRVRAANKAFYKRFQASKNDVQDKSIFRIQNGCWNIQKLRMLLEESLKKSSSFEDFEVEHDFPDLGPRKMVCNARRVQPPPGSGADKDRLILLAIEDVTERCRYQEELEKAKETADSANQAKSDFLANMSHEIRSPLTTILGFAEIMSDPQQSDSARIECMRTIERNGRILEQLIGDILDHARVEANLLRVTPLKVSFLSELKEVLLPLKNQADGKGLNFKVIFDGPVPQFIVTDFDRLRQILTNVISNAVKFTDTGAITLTIRLVKKDAKLEFSVTDTGCGIASYEAKRLFQPFSQVDNSCARKYGGTGLGLALSKRLARLLGGDLVLAKSRPGKGSTFQIRIDPGPLKGAALTHKVSEEDLALSQSPPPPHTHINNIVRLDGMRILLAEDRPDNQALVRHLLEKAGAAVDVAENGWEAVKKAQAGLHDLVLMDIQMPLCDGYEATASLRKSGYQAPIIALTAHAMKTDEKKCVEAGCNGVLTKPIDSKTLLATAYTYNNNKK